MSLNKLADVELQLIMHGLEGFELLQFARCNRQFMKLAESLFAWKFTPLTIRSNQLSLPSLRSCRFTRLIPIAFVFESKPRGSSESVAYKLIESLFCLCDDIPSMRLQSIDASGWKYMHSFMWPTILARSSCIMHLHTLILSGPYSWMVKLDVLRLIIAAPSLRTLRMQVSNSKLQADEETWSEMMASPSTSMTALDVEESEYDDGVSNLNNLVALAGFTLTNLTIRNPRLYGGEFRRLFSPLNQHVSFASQLRSLTIERFHAKNWKFSAPSAEDYLASFTALSNLHSLVLIRCFDVDTLLFHASAAPSLRQVIIEPDCSDTQQRQEQSSTIPSNHAIVQLLTAAVTVHIELHLNVQLDNKDQAVTTDERNCILDLQRRYESDERFSLLGLRVSIQTKLQ